MRVRLNPAEALLSNKIEGTGKPRGGGYTGNTGSSSGGGNSGGFGYYNGYYGGNNSGSGGFGSGGGVGSLGVSSSRTRRFTPYCKICNFRGHTKEACFKAMQCSYCNMRGYTRDNCYKLIVYPADFKGKKKISAANVQNQHTGDNEVTPHPHHVQQPHFTMEQYNQIMRLLNRPQLNETSANANMTGILASSSSLINTHPTHSQWIVDSGATNHMVNDNSIFNTGLTISITGKVQIPTDDNVLMPIFHPTKIAEEFPIERLGECDIEPLIDSIETETMVEAASSVDSVGQPPVRRTSTRISKPPIWQKDFITKTCSKSASSCLYPIEDNVAYDNLAIPYQSCSKRLIDNAKQVLKNNFKIKDLRDLRYFLGIEFARNSEGILMHQRKYAMELIPDSEMSGSKPCATPVEVKQKLTTSEFDDHFKLDNGNVLLDSGEYQRLVGRLLYLTITRPDIAFAVQILSQFMHVPKSSHMEAALRVVKYVKQAAGFGILMSAKPTNILQGFCDADWGSCIHSRRSITGYMIMFGNSLIFWKSKK
uniref:Reverse transcriptase Ty1/copia-type domain-containing protein n=1 Tax=Solanum lycopersicum TaxID=4081 RepID=A0A3Q7HXW2_SOLLC